MQHKCLSYVQKMNISSLVSRCYIFICSTRLCQKIMWKLSKSIAKELLPALPADLAIEPWWGVRFVNFTLEEFKVRFISDKFSLCKDIVLLTE